MSKHYGDLPCVNLNGTIHITISGTKLVCGKEWAYGRPSRSEKRCINIIWRKPEAVTCVKCKELYMQSLISGKDVVIVSPLDSADRCGYTGTISIIDEIKRGNTYEC